MHKIAKIASKSTIKPVLAGVLFRKDKIVATDAFKLIELSNQPNHKLDILIPASNFKAGDEITEKGEIKRKDGSIFHPVAAQVKPDYPAYDQLMPSKKDLGEHYEVIRLTKSHLIDLLEAMPSEQVRLYIPKGTVNGKYRPAYVQSLEGMYGKDGNARGLIMPVADN